jgi:hypothetical protein
MVSPKFQRSNHGRQQREWRIAREGFSIEFIGITAMPTSSGASRSIDEILMPGGKPIGVKGTGPRASARLREVAGGQTEAERLFQELMQGGKDVTPAGYPGTLIELPNGRGTVGYRPASKSGPATIDVKAVDTAGQPIPIKKIKFVD